MLRSVVPLLLLVSASFGCAGMQPVATDVAPREIDSAQLLTDIRTLAADSMQGRRTGTVGSERARAYLLGAFERHRLLPLGGSYEHPFTFSTRRDSLEQRGINLLGYIRGTESPDRYVVVTAHYDHVGVTNGEIFNGADDNASGTAALFALAQHFRQNPPRNSILFAALDAEEMGLQGARAFVASPPLPREAMVMNVNMDMVSRSARDELYAVGTHHYPFLRPYVERVAARAPLTLLMGHDSPELPAGEDWTMSSDHGAFHQVRIPFIYFGVEDHEDYHRPTDTFEKIDPDFYVRAVGTVIDFVVEVDRDLSAIAAQRQAALSGGR